MSYFIFPNMKCFWTQLTYKETETQKGNDILVSQQNSTIKVLRISSKKRKKKNISGSEQKEKELDHV